LARFSREISSAPCASARSEPLASQFFHQGSVGGFQFAPLRLVARHDGLDALSKLGGFFLGALQRQLPGRDGAGQGLGALDQVRARLGEALGLGMAQIEVPLDRLQPALQPLRLDRGLLQLPLGRQQSFALLAQLIASLV